MRRGGDKFDAETSPSWSPLVVMVALVATIHVFTPERQVRPSSKAVTRHQRSKTWMVGTSPTMTTEPLPPLRRKRILTR